VKELDPHLFKIAEEAFRAMKANVKNQEIIISGISGSGKTEVAKLMLAYLANACNNFRYLDAGITTAEELFNEQISDSESDNGND